MKIDLFQKDDGYYYRRTWRSVILAIILKETQAKNVIEQHHTLVENGLSWSHYSYGANILRWVHED